MREISNDEFEAARTPQIRELITSITKSYAGSLCPGTLQCAGDMALWRCLKKHDPKYGSSFTTSLYRFINWECLHALRIQRNKTVTLVNDIEGPGETATTHMILDDCLRILGTKERRIIEARFLENCTFEEIGLREGYSKQGIKIIVDRSISTMSEAAKAA
jgi:RNA polymerase sigma factor (sigma-70 family)